MQKNFKLVLDNFCEVFELLEPWADETFWDFANHEIIPGALYLVSQKEIRANKQKFRDAVENNLAQFIFSQPAEGSETLIGQCHVLGITDLVKDGKVKLIGGGEMDSTWPYLFYASFMPKLLDYDENIHESARGNAIFTKTDKPYKFLFLNGRMRPHRKYLLERFTANELINSSIWTILDSRDSTSRHIKFIHNGKNMMNEVRPIHYLDPYYEVDRYCSRIGLQTGNTFVKYQLFDDTWGEIYLKAEPYIDTYFSLVTETVFEYPHSFLTEKIWKPIVMGHPFVVASNQGYYKSLHNQGYKTFGHLIDESFDNIETSQDRIERIAEVVEDLCSQDLSAFLSEAESVCKYNQQRYQEHRQEVRREFPNRFFNFVHQQFNFS